MDLSAAIALAARYANPKDLRHSAVVAEPGKLWAFNGVSGCEIPCESITESFVVDCAHFREQVRAVGSAAEIKVSETKVTVWGKGVKFTIQRMAEDKRPSRGEVPKRGWKAVPAAWVQSIAQVARLVGEQDVGGTFMATGLRLAPEWVAAATNHRGAVLWVAGLVDEAVTVSPALLDGLAGDLELVCTAKAVWVRSEDGQVRWTLPLEGGWPDEAFVSAVAAAREGSTAIQLAPADLERVAALALVEAENDLAAIRLEIGKDTLSFTGGPHEGVSGVEAEIEIEGGPKTKVYAGINPKWIKLAAAVLVGVAGGEEKLQLVMGEPTAGILLQNGDPPVEVLTMPLYLGE